MLIKLQLYIHHIEQVKVHTAERGGRGGRAAKQSLSLYCCCERHQSDIFDSLSNDTLTRALSFQISFAAFASVAHTLAKAKNTWQFEPGNGLISLSPPLPHLCLLLSISSPHLPLSCSWPKCKNQYPFVSVPGGDQSVQIRLSVPSAPAKFVSPLTPALTH